MKRLVQTIPWLLLVAWLLLVTVETIGQVDEGQIPPDLATYVRAAERINNGENLYLSIEETHAIWQAMNALEPVDSLSGEQPAVNPNIPGPYIYLPTLALWYGRTGVTPTIWLSLLFVATIGFSWLWLSRVHGNVHWWLLLVTGSLAVLMGIGTGNVELLLLLLTLFGAIGMWRSSLWVPLPIAFVILVKPFYALFFAAFGLLMLVNPEYEKRGLFRYLSAAAVLTFLLIGLDIALWSPDLRREALAYVTHALDYHWLVLPVEQQTPLSIWNRTWLQAMVNAGVNAGQAQRLSLLFWGLALAVTLWMARGRRISFALTFALGLALLYWGRPVGWGWLLLEIVVVSAAWPYLSRWPRRLLLGATVALMISHWWAFVVTAQGVWLRLVTMQSAEVPWESWLVAPVTLMVLLWATRNAESRIE